MAGFNDLRGKPTAITHLADVGTERTIRLDFPGGVEAYWTDDLARMNFLGQKIAGPVEVYIVVGPGASALLSYQIITKPGQVGELQLQGASPMWDLVIIADDALRVQLANALQAI